MDLPIGVPMPLQLPADLSVAQTGIWLDQQLCPGKPIYNTGQALMIRGPLRPDLFETALRETIAEAPGLQLSPRSHALRFELPLVDFRQAPSPIAAAEQWMRSEMRVPIPLDDPVLFRFALLQVADDHTIWFQKTHHIIIDATGRRLLSARTAARYRALRFGAPVPAVDAATPEDVLAAERSYATSGGHETDRAYWLAQFAQRPEPLLPANRRNSERGKSGCHARNAFTLKRSDFVRLDAAARSLGSSPFRAITALTYAAFASHYNRYDIVMGLELANRSDAREKQMIGILARPLPLSLNLDAATPLADVIRRLEEARKRDYPHRHFPIQELATALGLARKGEHGLFDVIVNFIPAAYDFSFEDIPVRLANLSYGFAAPWVVTIADTGSTQDLDVTIDTDPGLISADLAARMAACIENLLRYGMEDVNCPLDRLPIVPATDRATLLSLSAGEAMPLPQGVTLTTLCEAHAVRKPDAIALICGTEQLTFAELHERAARLARRLVALGVRPDVVVGIALPRTPALVIAVLAVHKAGGAYLALDPAYPAERIRFIVTDAATPLIVTDDAHAPIFADSGARLVLYGEQLEAEADLPEPVAPGPANLAYVLYTSGSTGRPKAVGIEHRNVINLVSWSRSIVSDAELGGILFSTSLNFDLSAFEIFLPMAFGGCIVMVENVLAVQAAPQRDKVRLVNTGPSLMDALLRTGGLPAGVTTVILAGERFPRRLANMLSNVAPGARLLNCYGPTETTVYSSWACIDPAARSEPPIGRAVWNTALHVLNSSGQLAPLGAEGELYIGGAGVGRGYLDRTSLTAERFLPNPFGDGRLYRTGDRVRWRTDGELDYLGRNDDQIKIHGQRIELGEIEAALLAVPGVARAAVTLSEDSAGMRRLSAYMVAAEGAAPETDRVRTAIERLLPRVMVPSSYVWLAVMPTTPNGKLDRKALPAPPREETRRTKDRPPETELERDIARIWEEVLRFKVPSVNSDFFDLGGDSLALLNLFAVIEARLGRHLSIDVLSGGLTILKMAQLLTEDEAPMAESGPILALQPRGHRPPFFCAPGIGGDVLHLHRLGVHMAADRPFFGFRWTAEGSASETVRDIAERYVTAMLIHQPTGPFYLGGYCAGSIIAYEMAQLLKERGHEIGMLALIDQRNLGRRVTLGNAAPALGHIVVNIGRLFRDQLSPFDTIRRIPVSIGRLFSAWWRKSKNNGGNEDPLTGACHLRALLAYRPMPLSAPVAVLRGTVTPLRSLHADRTLGWGDVVLGDVQVHRTPGDHRSITTEPLVRHLAKALSDILDRAESATTVKRILTTSGNPRVGGTRSQTADCLEA